MVLDAMSIRKQIEFDQHNKRFIGCVDLGSGPEEDSNASEVLVFMLVGLNGKWKAPVAYFLTNVLSAETQKQLLFHCLERLHELGFEVLALTADGHATNIAMWALLGADLNPNSNAYKVSIQPVDGQQHPTYVFIDVCHVMKLLRNTLHAYSGIRSKDGIVSWELIHSLYQAQEDAGLTLANKLTAKHIGFSQQKMKVSLAVQVFSNSVAKALRSMKAMGDPRFADCDATASFIEVRYVGSICVFSCPFKLQQPIAIRLQHAFLWNLNLNFLCSV